MGSTCTGVDHAPQEYIDHHSGMSKTASFQTKNFNTKNKSEK